MNSYIICGYGIPKEIEKDQNYLSYLHLAFNKIYTQSAKQEASVIFCGGPTNCEAPYQGTEAKAMAYYLRTFMGREELRESVKQWELLEEDKSLSTLENLVFANALIEKNKLTGKVVVFCEASRRHRLEVLAEKVFKENFGGVESIDFDRSKNRYLDPEIIKKKEDIALKEALWTLEDPARLALHHQFFEKKFAFFRERQSEGVPHVDVVEEWFIKGPELLKEMMPDHPLLNE